MINKTDDFNINTLNNFAGYFSAKLFVSVLLTILR